MIHGRDQNCRACLHYVDGQKCLAFPDGIPADLWSGENLHREAYEGDNGYRYQRKFNEPPPVPQEMFEEWAKRGSNATR